MFAARRGEKSSHLLLLLLPPLWVVKGKRKEKEKKKEKGDKWKSVFFYETDKLRDKEEAEVPAAFRRLPLLCGEKEKRRDSLLAALVLKPQERGWSACYNHFDGRGGKKREGREERGHLFAPADAKRRWKGSKEQKSAIAAPRCGGE